MPVWGVQNTIGTQVTSSPELLARMNSNLFLLLLQHTHLPSEEVFLLLLLLLLPPQPPRKTWNTPHTHTTRSFSSLHTKNNATHSSTVLAGNTASEYAKNQMQMVCKMSNFPRKSAPPLPPSIVVTGTPLSPFHHNANCLLLPPPLPPHTWKKVLGGREMSHTPPQWPVWEGTHTHFSLNGIRILFPSGLFLLPSSSQLSSTYMQH